MKREDLDDLIDRWDDIKAAADSAARAEMAELYINSDTEPLELSDGINVMLDQLNHDHPAFTKLQLLKADLAALL